jgi:hypothetical protein
MYDIEIYFYSVTGKSLHTKVRDFNPNNLIRPIQIFNTQSSEFYHKYYKCGNVEPVEIFPAFVYYLERHFEGKLKFHMLISDAVSYRYENYGPIGTFLHTILNIHFTNDKIKSLSLYMPNIRTPYTKLTFNSRLSSEADLLTNIKYPVIIW